MFHNILLLKSSTNVILSNITTHTTFILFETGVYPPNSTQSWVIQLYKFFFFFFFGKTIKKIARAIL